LQDKILTANLFRHEYGKLVALLVRKMGGQHLEAIEDGVQWSMLQAVETWSKTEIPTTPAAWLYQVAYRHIISELTSTKRQQELLTANLCPPDLNTDYLETPLPGELNDSLLRMLFVTCHPSVPLESQLVFTLKTLCGFNIREISLRLFTSEENIYKRFTRAKKQLQKLSLDTGSLTNDQMINRLSSVHKVLYLIFTEGYLSSHPDQAIRQDLCDEAIYLTTLLIGSTIGDRPETHALMALIYFHYARLTTRQDASGALLLLEHQDRTQWNADHIATAMIYLNHSTQSKCISRYHIEAGSAAQHCLAPSFAQTNWQQIVNAYLLLEKVSPSPLHILNRALATAECFGPKKGLLVLESINMSPFLARSYHWFAVLSDLQKRSGKLDLAKQNALLAIQSAPTDKIKQILTTRLTNESYP
jgi:RNA polymerase sigma-70 factor (ECF subfamily)